MIRRILFRILPLLMLTSLFLAVACPAVETTPMREDLWRLNDYVEAIREETAYELDERILHIAFEKKMDLPICINNEFAGKSPAEFGAWFYAHNEFGYGEDREGLLLIVDTANHFAAVSAFGPICGERYPEAVRERMAKKVMDVYLTDGCESAVAAYLRFVDGYITENRTLSPEGTSADGDAAGSSAPNVVDKADLFTMEEERGIGEQLTRLREKHGADFVLLTDTTTHGLRKGVYGAEFYDFNGYGVGEDRNGMFLFLCMEEGNRGWWQAGTGACESLFTEENIERLNARLDPYMIAGDHAAGVRAFFEDVDAMFASGESPDPPQARDWGTPIPIAALIGLVILVLCVFLHSRKKTRRKVLDELR